MENIDRGISPVPVLLINYIVGNTGEFRKHKSHTNRVWAPLVLNPSCGRGRNGLDLAAPDEDKCA